MSNPNSLGTAMPFSLYYGSWECPTGTTYSAGTPFNMSTSNMVLVAQSGSACVTTEAQAILASTSPLPLIYLYQDAADGPFTIQSIASDGSYITAVSGNSTVAPGSMIRFLVVGLYSSGFERKH